MAGQARAGMTAEEAEAIVAGAISELPEVASVHCEAEGDTWRLFVAHDYGRAGIAIDRIVDKVAEIEDRMPHLYIETRPITAARAGPRVRGMKMIYKRR